jgi:sugar transferase (PEP-CTERM system associated)
MRIRLFGHYFHTSIIGLALVEAIAFAGAVYLAALLRIGGDMADVLDELGPVEGRALAFAAVTMTGYLALGLYTTRQSADTAGVLSRIGVAMVLSVAGLSMVYYALPALAIWRGILLIAAGFALVFSVAARFVFARYADRRIFKRQVLVYGYGERAEAFNALPQDTDRSGFDIAGYLFPPGETANVPLGLQLDAPDGLLALCQERGVDEVVVAMQDRRRLLPMRQLLQCRLAGVGVSDYTSFMERETGRIMLDSLNPSWMIFGEGFRRDALRRFMSSVLNFTASFLLLLVTLPVVLFTVAAIWLEDGRKGAGVLYRQPRVGLGGRVFNVYKFRSMRADAEKGGKAQWATQNDPRITRIGAFIRKTRIDELPQLFNILRGDMSLVGPRPERPQFVEVLEEKIPYYGYRHSVKPGLAGWAQLCYPYGASEEDALQKLQYDLYYVKNHSFLFDLAILIQTAEVVIMGKGAR